MTRRIVADENGAILVVVALMLVVLLGFTALAVDVGWATVERRNMVAAADAGALAGAVELPSNPSQAVEKAEEYAVGLNNADRATVVVSDFTAAGDNRLITVVTEKAVDYKFAPVLGFDSVTVKAEAQAIVGPLAEQSHVVPLALPEEKWREAEPGELIEVKVSHWSDSGLSNGNFGALAFEGKGAKAWAEMVKHGYDGVVKVGDWVLTEPGNMSGKTRQAMEYRLDRGLLEVVVPVVGEPTKSGRAKVQVLGFAVIRLEAVLGNGNNSIITATLLEKTFLPGKVGEGGDYGVYAVQLIK